MVSDPRNQENQPMNFFSEVEALANADDVDLREISERDPVTAETMPQPEPYGREDDDVRVETNAGGER